MRHQLGRKKLNKSASHRRSLIRNQVISFIMYGHLVTTQARVKEVRRLAEKLVTIAKNDTFSARRRAKALLPYKNEALTKLFKEIAPKYETRPGGYTRIIPLGRRISDTAMIAKLEWV